MYSTGLDCVFVGPYLLFIIINSKLRTYKTANIYPLMDNSLISDLNSVVASSLLLLTVLLFWMMFMLHIYRHQSCSLSAFNSINLKGKFLVSVFKDIPQSSCVMKKPFLNSLYGVLYYVWTIYTLLEFQEDLV